MVVDGTCGDNAGFGKILDRLQSIVGALTRTENGNHFGLVTFNTKPVLRTTFMDSRYSITLPNSKTTFSQPS